VFGKRVFINTLNGNKVFGVAINPDGSAGTVTEIKLDRPIERPDGMRRFGNSMLLIESGGAGRLDKLTVTGDSGQLTTIKEGYPDGPVSVAVVGPTGYVLEGQLKGLRGNQPLNPFHATAVTVGAP